MSASTSDANRGAAFCSVLAGLTVALALAAGCAPPTSQPWPGPYVSPGPPGRFPARQYRSNGERIYFTGANDRGELIPFDGGPHWVQVHGGGCAACHGAHGRGGVPVMMVAEIPPDIRYRTLTTPGRPGEEQEEVYTDELIRRAITQGLHADGEPLSLAMPRWRLSPRDLNDVVEYLKRLNGRGDTPREG